MRAVEGIRAPQHWECRQQELAKSSPKIAPDVVFVVTPVAVSAIESRRSATREAAEDILKSRACWRRCSGAAKEIGQEPVPPHLPSPSGEQEIR